MTDILREFIRTLPEPDPEPESAEEVGEGEEVGAIVYLVTKWISRFNSL
jgi:hypothetical protein